MSTDSIPPKSLSPLLARIVDYNTLRLNEQETAIRHYVACQDALRQQLQAGKINQTTFNNELNILDDTTSDTMLEFHILDKQFRLVAQDMEDEALGMKAVGTPTAGDDELVEKAYFAVVREAKKTEIMWRQRYFDASAKRPDKERPDLDRRVLSYYDALRTMHEQKQAHCSLTGWHPEEEVGVAQLVPDCISSEQIAFFFGASHMNLVSGKNCWIRSQNTLGLSGMLTATGIPLHKNLAHALDCGIITFIPLPPPAVDLGPTWTCILVDDGFRDRVFAITPDGKKLTYRDIHGTPLTFHNHHRPARRFLFFHFVISYLRAQSLESPVKPNIAWPVPGRYVDKESLLMLGRSISGTELPELLYKGMVFEKLERPADFADVALCLAVREWVKRTVEAGKNGTGCIDPSKEGDGDLSTEHVSEIAQEENDEDARDEGSDNDEEEHEEHDVADAPSKEAPTTSKGRKKKKKKGSQKSSN